MFDEWTKRLLGRSSLRAGLETDADSDNFYYAAEILGVFID